MSNHHPEENETLTNEYSEIFAKLAAEEKAEVGNDEGEMGVEPEAEISTLESETEAVEVELEAGISASTADLDEVEITASLAELKPAI